MVIDEWLVDYQRAGETGTVEAQLDIIWPTTDTPNSTEAPEDRCFRLIGSQSAADINDRTASGLSRLAGSCIDRNRVKCLGGLYANMAHMNLHFQPGFSDTAPPLG